MGIFGDCYSVCYNLPSGSQRFMSVPRAKTVVAIQSPSFVWLCTLMSCNTPDFGVLHCLLEFAQIHVHWGGDAIQPSYPLSHSSLALNLSQHKGRSFPMSRLFTSGDQSVGASASASVLPVNIQVWFPLGLTGLISLKSQPLTASTQHPKSHPDLRIYFW